MRTVTRALIVVALIVGTTKVGAQPNPMPPASGGAGTWTRLSTGTGAFGWYFSHATVERNGAGRIWHTWNGLTYLFDPVANRWAPVPAANNVGFRENFGSDHDTDNGVIWIGPQASKPGPFDGLTTFHLATNQYADAPPSGCSGDSIFGWDQTRKLLYCFAGWTTRPLMARSTASLSGTWIAKNPSGPFPAATQDSARVSMLRGGIDSRTGALWYIGDREELYWYDPAKNAWALIVTTGAKPHSSTVFALHEAANTIVGFMGCEQLTDPCATRVARTYLLDLGTRVWRAGPDPGANSPTAVVMVKYIPLYDRVRGRVLLMAASDGSEVWQWRPGAGALAAAPAPADPAPARQAPPPSTPPTPPPPPGQVSSPPPGPPSPPPQHSPSSGQSSPPAHPPSSVQSPPSSEPSSSRSASVPGPTGSVPTRTFVARPLPAKDAPFIAGTGSKDVNRAFDGKRLILGAGDIVNSGDPSLYAYDVAANTWTLLSGTCLPAGQVMMNHPTDRGPMIVDKRGDLWNLNNVPFPDQENQPCGGTGATQKSGLLRRNGSTGVWTQMPGARGGSIGGGAYDSAADAMLHFEGSQACSGNPGRLVVTSLANLSQQAFDLCLRPNPAWTTATGGWLSPELPQRVFFAWDDRDRVLYAVVPQRRKDAPGNDVEVRASLFAFDRKTNRWSMKAPAPVRFDTGIDFSPYHIATIDFDPVNRRVLWPVVKDGPCGTIQQMLAYDPAKDAWEEFPVPAGIYGNMAAFDPAANVLLIAGREFCGKQQHLFLWRYGP